MCDTAYKYQALPDPEAEVRVAMLQPGAYHDDICISFFSRPFGSRAVSEVLGFSGDIESEVIRLTSSAEKVLPLRCTFLLLGFKRRPIECQYSR
jgi:hypothetical protein